MNLPDQRPIIVAIAGPNGAGKTTFYNSQLNQSGLRFINADILARSVNLDPYTAADMADAIRRELVEQRQSFIFETVFSDPVGDKLKFLQAAADAGYAVVLCYIGISSVQISNTRVAMRVSQGGHDVPLEKLKSRFPRTLANLASAIRKVNFVYIFDNDNLDAPFRLMAAFENGVLGHRFTPWPRWVRAVLRNVNPQRKGISG